MPPIVCGTLLTAMMAAGVSHFWSVEKFIVDYPITPTVRSLPITPTDPAPDAIPSPQENPKQLVEKLERTVDDHSKEFFENLIQELRNLRNENRALTDQIAETNRDVMKMQFQIDTYSESFRTLPTSQERDDRSQMYEDDYPSVLPPRYQPAYPLDE